MQALRPGYRIFQLRDERGTPIEMCSLFVHIEVDRTPHHWRDRSDLQKQAPPVSLRRRSRLQRLHANSRGFSAAARGGFLGGLLPSDAREAAWRDAWREAVRGGAAWREVV